MIRIVFFDLRYRIITYKMKSHEKFMEILETDFGILYPF